MTTALLPDPPALDAGNALFLDFDGTLAPLQDDPNTVYLPEAAEAALGALAERLNGALAVLSGRGLDDLVTRVPTALWRLGNHGLYQAAPGTDTAPLPQETAPRQLLEDLQAFVDGEPDTRIEEKGPVVALHYRHRPDLAPTIEDRLQRILLGVDGYYLQHGKRVVEFKPDGANKGQALARLMGEPPFAGRAPVMIGDDTTDEDAFAAAKALGGVAIKVGDGPTCAEFRLSGVDAVHTYLSRFA